jgi:hypothetical protein
MLTKPLTAVVTALALAGPALTHGGQDDPLPFEELARDWLTRHEVEGEVPDGIDLDTLLAHDLTRIRLGAFELYVPPSVLLEAEWQDEIGGALHAVFRVQEQWAGWAAGEDGVPEDLEADLKTVGAFLKSWRGRLPKTAKELAGVELLTTVAAKDDQREALDGLAEALLVGGPLGLEKPRAARMILMPSRQDFLGFASLVGWKVESWRDGYWVDDLRNWAELDYAGTRVLALEFAAPGNDPFRGLAMTAKNPDGLEQHVAQLATRSLFEAWFGDRMEPMLAAGLANSMVIDVFGEVDTRTDGDLRAREKSARSVFIPGGNSNGGTLPAQDANSRWRDGMGRDHFVKVLRQAQKAGAKEAKGRTNACFLIQSDDELEQTTVCAPFFAAESAATDPPAEFVGDYVEFLRSYRAAFLYWMREQAEGTTKKSRARFATFLRTLAAAPEGSAMTAVVASAYEAPLSGAEMDKSSLEGRFLAWLQKK